MTSPSIEHVPTSHVPDALEAVLNRRSVKFVSGPGPDEQQLKLILQAGMSAPDHGAMRPWRYTLIRGEAISRLADMVMTRVREAGDTRMTPEKERSVRAWLAGVPLLVAVAQRIDHDNTKIPQQEQLLAVGASVMNILNAAHILGFGAFWSTGLGTYVESVQEALGYDSLDYTFLGFLAIGTPVAPVTPAQRPDSQAFVTEWTGE